MMGQPTPREQIDRVLALVRRTLSFWKRGLIVFVVGVLIVVPIVFTRPRDYKSETVILYHETIHSDLQGEEGGGGGGDARRVGARLRELLLSRQSLEPIINDLHLFQDKIIRGEAIGAVEEMRKHITFRARDGDTFEISFVGSTPEQAQEVTRRLGDCIVKEADNRRADSAKTLKEFLNNESTRNQAELSKKETELASFVAAHPEFTPRLQGIAPQLTPTASGGAPTPATPNVDPILASLESKVARIERQLKAAQGQAVPPTPKPTFQSPPDSQELVAARADLADKMNRFTEKHPDVIAAKNRLKSAEQAQAAAVEAAREQWKQKHAAEDDPPPPKNATDEAVLRKELSDLQSQIAARRAQLAKASGDAGAAAALAVAPNSNVALELEFTRLQREVNDLRDRQQKLEERVFRASMTASSVMNDRNVQVSVLDPAYLPVRPSSKPRTTLLAALLAVCIFLSIASMAASAMLDDKIYERVDIERLDVLPVIAVIPRTRTMRLPQKTDHPS